MRVAAAVWPPGRGVLRPAKTVPTPFLSAAAHETARDYGHVLTIYLVLTVTVGGLIAAAIGFVALRYRSGRRPRPSPGPASAPRAELAYVLVLLVLAATLATVTLRTERPEDASAHSPGLRVRVTASQWNWRFAYPHGVVTEGDGAGLVVPAGEVVQFRLGSRDVVHALWIPELRDKRYAYPDRVTTFAAVFQHTGRFVGECSQFCGLGHDGMRFAVHVVSPEDFGRWLAGRRP